MSKIFISYCHEDEKFLTEHLIPILEKLTSENGIEYFYDRKLRSGGELFDTIEYHMKDSDMAILLLSQSFYNSDACKKEKKNLLERKQLEGIYLLPLVISDCDWIEDKALSKDLLLNTDGIALKSLKDEQLKNELHQIKEKLIQIDQDIEIIKKLSYQESFSAFLEDTGVFKTSHKSRKTLKLSDVFVYPELRRYMSDENKNDDFDSEKLFLESKYAKPFVQTLFSKNNELSSHSFCLQSVCYQTCFVNFIRSFVVQPLMNPFTIEELYKFPETFSQFLCA